jgi:histidinol-phosphate aminotransferase
LDHQTTVLIDEAYHDYADSPDYESMLPLVESRPNLIVSRTFSKIYGMAGLRCGYCVAQKQIIDRLRKYQPWDSVNIMALTAASANLADADQVPNGRRLNREAKEFTVSELEKMGYRTIPSEANFIMIDVRRPIVPLIQAMGKNGVQVGRLFPAMPNHMRVTIGRKNEMEAFLKTFREVIV